MSIVTVSRKFQVVIPREVRERIGISPGQKMRAMALGGRIEFVPLQPAEALRGFLQGIDIHFKRDKDRV